ncbi:MAG TPA: Rap1a/Tai family immunity protein [Terriglobia bacterium]|nr:Rap1a/Tai family immunity protein [Terriglobia bacterium]
MRPAFPSIRALVILLAPLWSTYFATPASAFQMRSFTAGSQLYQVCSEDRESCYMYVYGVLDMVMLTDDANKTCTFSPEGIAGDKAVNAVLSYMRSHLDRLDWSAAALVQNAIRSKFPCPKQKGTPAPAPNPAE